MALTRDPDGDTRLRVTAQASGFSGTTTFWWEDPVDLTRFATEISRYPLNADALIEFVDGYGNWVNGSFEYEYLRLRVEPVGRVGQVRFLVTIAADELVILPSLPTSSARHQVHLELRTTYERIRRFSENLLAMAERRSGEARIEEELLG